MDGPIIPYLRYLWQSCWKRLGAKGSAEAVWIRIHACYTQPHRAYQGFLDRPRIYTTGFFHDLYEQQARANLTRAIAELTT
mgnify:CR=1 FL=1